MLVIISRSDDGTVNLVTEYLKSPYLRIDIDSHDSWSFSQKDGVWTLSSGDISHEISETSKVWWWKAYLDETDGDSFTNAEIEYIAFEIFNQISRVGRSLGNSPLSHKKIGKIAFLEIAKPFFRVPESIFLFNHLIPNVEKPYVAKSLASSPFSNGKVLYATKVDVASLNGTGNPWYLQQMIDADLDVTVFVVGQERFIFCRARSEGTLDWRKEQLEDLNREAWLPYSFSASQTAALEGLIAQLGISWGRFDLLRDRVGDLWMLELNWNGQFGFLDPLHKHGVIRAVANFLEAN